jgi:hypothetical protein
MRFVLWPWLTLVLLGAWHGLNPAMGWLFAVALGLQQRSRGAVFRALIPIAVGHALAVGLVVFISVGYVCNRISSFRAWYCGTGSLAASERRDDSSRTGRMEAVANAASDLGRDAGRFLGSYRLVLDHGERTRCGSDADTAPTRSNLRRNVQRQSAITIFQFAFGRWRCARSYHLTSRRGRNHRLAGLRLHWPGRAAPIVVQRRSDLVV